MLTDEETYKVQNWQELKEKLEEYPLEILNKAANSGRSLLLEGKYYCNLAIYEKTQRINAFFIGLQRQEGKALLEARLGIKLESIEETTRFTPEESKLLAKLAEERKKDKGPIVI